MESSFLHEKKIISICFNPIRESVFILSLDSDKLDKLDLTEEDLSKNIILRRFKLLKMNECNIQNSNYRKLPKDTYEGFGLYFWELAQKLIVIYPFGYVMIFDNQTSQLNYHFQCQGKKAYVIRNIIGSPIQRSLFISAEKMRNIYHIAYDSLKNITYQKLVLPQNEIVYDLVCHPNEKFIFVACSDSLVRVYDYSNTNNIIEVKNGLVDIPMGKDNKPLKNQNEIIKKSNFMAVITMDINHNGTYLLSGNENGNVYLWDALQAIKNKRLLLSKERFSGSGILSLKFIRTKQFENLNRFICLTKEGKFFICNIVMKEENNSKNYSFNKLYENSIFNPIIYSLNKYNIVTSNFIHISYFSNIICLKWPSLRMDKIIVNDKKEDYLLFTSFHAKFFFIYDNVFPKINFAIATRMKFRNYEEYIPITNKSNLVYERKIFIVDSFFIYFYDIMTGSTKRMLNYAKEFNLKSVYPLKFESRNIITQSDSNTSSNSGNEIYFVILVENENYKKFVLLIHYDTLLNQVKLAQKFDDVIDFVLLGNCNDDDEEEDLKYIFLLNKNKQHAMIYDMAEKKTETRNIEGSIVRVYWTPFANGYCVLYRNVLSELKFSSNLKSSDTFDYRCINDNSFRMDYSEREIDVVWRKIKCKGEGEVAGGRYLCAISMIEKIIITDDNMRILYSYKIGLQENPNIISSLFWIGKTLFYSKGSSINYFYGEDNTHQKIFTSDQPNAIISGILSDRYILVSKISGSKDLNNIVVTTPMLNPLEPILIGYLDHPNVDYNLVKEAVTNMFTNQFSQNLINKLLTRDLKEVAWVFLSDNKSSFQNIDKKVQVLNDLLKFDLCLDYMLPNKSLQNEMDLDDLIWRFAYDDSVCYIKDILIGEFNILINYGQFDWAMKILEILGDYPKAINLLLISSSKEEYEKLKVLFQAKGCLSYTDNLLINNVFRSRGSDNDNKMKHYQKIFDNYKGEPFIFGANQDKFNILSIKEAVNKINKKNSHISNFQKRILSYGEIQFTQYTQLYNRETSKYDLVNISSLILQKIDQYFGHKNTVYEKNSGQATKKVDFTDYNVPLSNLKPSTNKILDADGDGDADDDSIDHNAEEISEAIYLSAYFHCDKGSGNIVEDITENNTEASITIKTVPVSVPVSGNISHDISNNDMQGSLEDRKEDNYLWSNVLEEFEPLEYEDKWGRKSPGSHAITFSKKNGSNFKIKHSRHFLHFSKKFTIEFWIKILNINVSVISKEGFTIDIQNGVFITHYQNKLLSPIKILDYQIPCDKWSHITISYKKKSGRVRIFVNCEETVNFNVTLAEDIGLRGDINIGNSNLEGEMTEIRIWNQEIPLKFIKENFKSPLPILAENKRKLRMKINKQEENAGKKKFELNKNLNTNRFQSFAFGGGKLGQGLVSGVANNLNVSSNMIQPQELPSIRKFSVPTIPTRNNQIVVSNYETMNLDISAIAEVEDPESNNNNLYEFNPTNFNEASIVYPSMTSIINQDKSILGNAKFENNNIALKNQNFDFNDNNFNNNNEDNNQTVILDFNKEDEFNFDK